MQLKNVGAKGLAWLKVNDDLSLSGPIAKFIDEESKNKMFEITKSKPSDSIFFIAETLGIAEKQAGQIRTELANRLDLLEKESYRFCWIIDFPMYELNDKGEIEFGHNPFSMPQGGLDSLVSKEPLEILAHQYDLVCNGYEIASRSYKKS